MTEPEDILSKIESITEKNRYKLIYASPCANRFWIFDNLMEKNKLCEETTDIDNPNAFFCEGQVFKKL